MTDFVVYDVFTDSAFGGNPLAVIPDARGLEEDSLQKVAREFNFSESTFVFPPADPAHDARVRIFTPTREIPFAGHPTVGTACALNDLCRVGADMVLELGVGPIPVTVANGRTRFVTEVPLETWAGPSVEIAAAAAGLDADAIRIDRHAPVIAGVGIPFALAELTGMDALEAATGVTDAFRAFEPMWPVDGHFDLLIYVREGDAIRARMFAPLDGIPEDPATGSAAAALAAFLGRLDGRSARFDVRQGVEMGRPSRIEAKVTVEDGRPVSVAVAGGAVKVMEGRLTL